MRINNFTTRLKIAVYFLFCKERKHIRVMTCGRCNTMNIEALPDTCKYGECPEENVNLYWEETCKCLKCGAQCREMQLWSWEEGSDHEPINNNGA